MMTGNLKYALAAVAMMAAPAAQALTINQVQLDTIGTTITFAGSTAPVTTASDINGQTIEFSWSKAPGETEWASAAIEFEIFNNAKLTFDSYVNAPGEQSALHLYNVGPGVALTDEASGVPGQGVALVQGAERDFINSSTSGVLFDAIDGSDLFGPGTYVLGFTEGSPGPEAGSFTVSVTAVPLPASVFLMLAGLGALGAARRFAS
jgi:hypothetical protein